MADMMSTLRGILGDGADDKIKTAMSMLTQSGILGQEGVQKKTEDIAGAINNDIKTGEYDNKSEVAQTSSLPALTPEGLELLGQMKSMVDRILAVRNCCDNAVSVNNCNFFIA